MSGAIFDVTLPITYNNGSHIIGSSAILRPKLLGTLAKLNVLVVEIVVPVTVLFRHLRTVLHSFDQTVHSCLVIKQHEAVILWTRAAGFVLVF